MKLIAYYLPQFHEVEENNKWWGKGFTEWTNVKSAKPYFKNHHQPVIPLNSNYYDLTDIKSLEWQTKLLSDYNVFGLCYYHYWFKGRKVLEKPMELLKDNRQIDQNYCICWANHSWNRNWNGSKEVTIKQEYGSEEDWEEHINYLLDFFKDDRYIKIDERPLFILYDRKGFNKFDEMFTFWNRILEKNGMKKLYLIESINDLNYFKPLQSSDGVTLRMPAIARNMKDPFFSDKRLFRVILRTLKNLLHRDIVKLDYTKVCNTSIKISENYIANNKSSKKIFLGAFSNWDNTPRYGKKGTVLTHFSLNSFANYLEKLQKLTDTCNEEIVFINAWNEWGEGMYLEPDEKNKYGLLEAIRDTTVS